MDRKVRKIEKLADGGLLVELSDGTTTRYATASALPGDVAALLARLDAAEPDGQAQGSQGGAEASRARYLQRLEQAHQQGQGPDPHQGLTGKDRYLAELQDRWQERPAPKQLHSHKHWPGA